MRHHNHRSFRDQAAVLRRQFLQDGGGLPFTDVLTDDVLADALAAVGGWLDRVFSPLVTLWVFLGLWLAAGVVWAVLWALTGAAWAFTPW